MAREWAKCSAHPWYFCQHYIYILNVTPGETGGGWIPLNLWPAQAATLDQIHSDRLVVILKARQIGFSWLCLAYILWLMLFWPMQSAGIFSRRGEDAQDLLENRIKGMYQRLPAWMKARSVVTDNKSEWTLSNGSTARAFPTNGGRSYTFSIVLMDEADFQPELARAMEALKPTIDAGGRFILLSTTDKDRPISYFKNVFRSAQRQANEWRPIFLPWQARPDRDLDWYKRIRRDSKANTGSLDSVYQEYPATPAQALAARVLGKRIPFQWIQAVYQEIPQAEIPPGHARPPAIPELKIYRPPAPGRRYVVGLDPAEGNPTSDPSAGIIMDTLTGEEAATFSGRLEPATFADYAGQIAKYYGGAAIMVERNNHGHAVILGLKEYHPTIALLYGHDDRIGWLSSPKGKAMLYSRAAETLQAGDALIHDWTTQEQLAALEGSTLRAPEGDGQHDDQADAWALANVARLQAGNTVDSATIDRAFSYIGPG